MQVAANRLKQLRQISRRILQPPASGRAPTGHQPPRRVGRSAQQWLQRSERYIRERRCVVGQNGEAKMLRVPRDCRIDVVDHVADIHGCRRCNWHEVLHAKSLARRQGAAFLRLDIAFQAEAIAIELDIVKPISRGWHNFARRRQAKIELRHRPNIGAPPSIRESPKA